MACPCSGGAREPRTRLPACLNHEPLGPRGPSLGSGSPDLILSGTEASGDGWFAVGNVDEGFTVFAIAAGDGATVTDAAAWIDAEGTLHTFVVADNDIRYGSALY